MTLLFVDINKLIRSKTYRSFRNEFFTNMLNIFDKSLQQSFSKSNYMSNDECRISMIYQ